MLRRGAQAGFTPDEVAAAAYAAASERKRPGEEVRVLFAECTTADAGYDAERLNREFAGSIEAEGTLLDELPERLERFHYDLVATTTFHADEAQVLVAGRVPVVAMLVGPGYVEMVHEIAGLPEGSRIGVVCATDRGTDNIAETLSIAGTKGVEIVSATIADDDRLTVVDRTADLILMSREALAQGLDKRMHRPERIRPWTYEFDPAGLELLRQKVAHIAQGRRGAAESASVASVSSSGRRIRPIFHRRYPPTSAEAMPMDSSRANPASSYAATASPIDGLPSYRRSGATSDCMPTNSEIRSPTPRKTSMSKPWVSIFR